MATKNTSRGRNCQLSSVRSIFSRHTDSVGSTEESRSAKSPVIGSVSTSPRMSGTARSVVSSRTVSVARRVASTTQVTNTITGSAASSRTRAVLYRSGWLRAIASARSTSTVRIDSTCRNSLAAVTMPIATSPASRSVGATSRVVPCVRGPGRSTADATPTHRSQLIPGIASQMRPVLRAATRAEPAHSLTSTPRWAGEETSGNANGAVVMCSPSMRSNRGRQRAKASLPAVEIRQGVLEIRGTEVRPPPVGEIQLGVRTFPQQEIAQPPLTARPDQQVDVGTEPARIPMRPPNCFTRRIVYRKAEMQLATTLSELFCGANLPYERGLQAIPPANDGESNAVLTQRGRFGGKISLEKTHERGHFARWTLPVVGRERVQRERLDADTWCCLDNTTDRVSAGAMAGGAWKSARGGPSAVSIHNDRDVKVRGSRRITLCHKV